MLKGHPELSGIRLVAHTGYGSPEDRQKAREAGFDAHLVKPAELEELEKALRGN
jgi:CheY-like chemotaxis protein